MLVKCWRGILYTFIEFYNILHISRDIFTYNNNTSNTNYRLTFFNLIII